MTTIGRLVMAFVGAVVSGLALTCALLLSFVVGPLGMVAGLIAVAGAPLLTMRVVSPFREHDGGPATRAVVLTSWGAVGLAVALGVVLGIPVTRGDAYDEAWLILAYASVCTGAVVGALLPNRIRLERH